MLFSQRHSNERDIFRGSCIDFMKSRLRKNLKAPASSRIMPFLKTNKQTNKTKLRQNMWCSFAEQLLFHICEGNNWYTSYVHILNNLISSVVLEIYM